MYYLVNPDKNHEVSSNYPILQEGTDWSSGFYLLPSTLYSPQIL